MMKELNLTLYARASPVLNVALSEREFQDRRRSAQVGNIGVARFETVRPYDAISYIDWKRKCRVAGFQIAGERTRQERRRRLSQFFRQPIPEIMRVMKSPRKRR